MNHFKLYAWGANNYGQLANGQPCEQLERPLALDAYVVDGQTHLELGGGHTLMLNQGILYSSGWNNKDFHDLPSLLTLLQGQCGVETNQDLSTFQPVKSVKNIKHFVAGWDFSLAIDDNGTAYGCGSNAFGQLGFGDKVKAVNVFEKLDIDAKVIKCAAGMRHALFLTSDHQLYASGAGKKGQLFSDEKVNQMKLEKVELDKKVIDVQAGQNYSIAIFEDGTLLACGDDKYGQVSALNQFSNTKEVKQVQLGWTHAIILLHNGQIQGFGRNDYGQISAKSDFKCSSLSSGYEHCLAIDNKKRLLSWGWNEHGNCGLGHTDDIFNPQRVCDIDSAVIKCFAGSGHSFAISEIE